MKSNRALVLAAYLVATFLVLVPLTEAATRVWPLRLGEARWRFGAIGVTSRALMTPFLGMLLAVGVAWLRNHQIVLRTLAILCAVGAVGVGLAAGVFVLDGLQMRGQVRSESLQAFDFTTVPALAKLILGVPTLLALGLGGWIAARDRRKRSASEDSSRKRSNLVAPPSN